MAASGRFTKTVDGCDFVYDYVCNKCTMNNEAVLYCPSCDIYYCKLCLQYTCKHVLLGQNAKDEWGKKKAPVPINEEVECHRHKGYRLDLYCRRHDAVCCALCAQLDHKDCHMEFTPDVAGEATLLESERELQSYAQKLRQRAGDIGKKRIGRQKDAKTQKASEVKAVQDFIRRMITTLKTLETSAIRDIENHTATCDGALQADIDVCDVTVTELTQVQKTLAHKEKDRVTTFIRNKKVKESLKITDKKLTDIENKQTLENENSSFNLNLNIETSLSKFDKLGSFQTTPVSPCKTPTRPSKSSSRPYKAVNKTDVSVKVRGDKNTCDIYGVCQLPDGSIVVSDWGNDKLKKLDRSYKVTCHCSLPASPWGVCHIDGDEVAVALGNKTIQFVSVGDSMTLTRSISPGHDCTGVAHHQGRLYVTGGGGCGLTSETPALYVHNMSGTQLQVFTKDQNGKNMFTFPCFIAISPNGNTVYVSDRDKGLVTMDTQGHVLATYSSSGLEGAEGVSVVDDGSVFVGGCRSHNVIQVGEEGNKKLADVVTSSAGIKYPRGICHDKRGSKLIIGLYSNDCLAVFDLTQ